jgi:hypothetical protein
MSDWANMLNYWNMLTNRAHLSHQRLGAHMSVGAFGIEKEGLEELLKEASIGKSQLPEFQRGWVWADRNIAGLIASISLGYPVGTIMMLGTGGSIKFKERPVEGVKLDKTLKAERLILDGQQRITSLYRALMHPEAIETVDIRKKAVKGWFYIDIDATLKELEIGSSTNCYP